MTGPRSRGVQRSESVAILTPVFCSIADTVGEFVRGVWSSGLGFPVYPNSPRLWPNGPRWKLANSIHFYSRATSDRASLPRILRLRSRKTHSRHDTRARLPEFENAKDPKYQLLGLDTKPADLKKPVKVFILLGRSIMLGIGEVGPGAIKGTLDYLTKEKGRYPHLLDDKDLWTSRSDVRYRRAGGRNKNLDELIADIETTTDSPTLVDPGDFIARASASGDASTNTQNVSS